MFLGHAFISHWCVSVDLEVASEAVFSTNVDPSFQVTVSMATSGGRLLRGAVSASLGDLLLDCARPEV